MNWGYVAEMFASGLLQSILLEASIKPCVPSFVYGKDENNQRHHC